MNAAQTPSPPAEIRARKLPARSGKWRKDDVPRSARQVPHRAPLSLHVAPWRRTETQLGATRARSEALPMESAPLPSEPPPRSATAAREPHLKSLTAEPHDEGCAGNRAEHDRRIALIGSVSGSRLQRLGQWIRHEYASNNGRRGCSQIRGGSVDCCCDYCTFFWSRLEVKLRGEPRRARS